jgi:hypothetical protein
MLDAVVTTGTLLVTLRKLSARNSYRQISWFPLELEDRMNESIVSKNDPLNEGNIGNKDIPTQSR